MPFSVWTISYLKDINSFKNQSVTKKPVTDLAKL
jgi:hypothetical protein